MPEYQNILVNQDGRVGIITLNRPRALNALNAALSIEVLTAAQELDTNPDIGAIVIAGSNRAFAGGADIKEMVSQS
ncbi:enoyl-CoA hydratase/carnithine racemase [Arthrobacter ginsengisoli]|uniref:Enoyl-CoA hydratase/carnithine racemase n=1 Tax=Arthrobacter ginsengisoli TaxID=1356565 RepID=A0ABU1UI27_9MICC|nr:enoyl-CoA hydratase/carnithine racemase [Arthrobacter ginsengisoli]